MHEYFLWPVAVYGWFLNTRTESISKMYGMWFFALSTNIKVTARKNCNEVIKIFFFPQALKISTVCHGAKWHGSWTSVPTIVFKKCSWILTDLWVIVSSWLETISLCMPWDMGGPQAPSVYLCWTSLVHQVQCARAEPWELGHSAACLSFSPSSSSAAQTFFLKKCIN